MKNKSLLLTLKERNDVANSVLVDTYATYTQYWDAIIDAEIKAQLDKVLKAGFEPVQLEVLPPEEICDLVTEYHFSGKKDRHILSYNISQATIAHNEAKGQLYRRRE